MQAQQEEAIICNSEYGVGFGTKAARAEKKGAESQIETNHAILSEVGQGRKRRLQKKEEREEREEKKEEERGKMGG